CWAFAERYRRLFSWAGSVTRAVRSERCHFAVARICKRVRRFSPRQGRASSAVMLRSPFQLGSKLRLGTWSTRNGLMPAGQVGELRSYFYVCQTVADVDCDQRGDIGNRETVASDKLVPVQLAIHPFESLMHDPTLRFAVVRELLVTTFKERV